MINSSTKLISIAKATERDVLRIIHIRRISRESTYLSLFSKKMSPRLHNPNEKNAALIKKYKGYLSDPRKNIYVAKYKNKIVGYIFSETILNNLRIRSLFVIKQFQNKGAGTLLLKKAIETSSYEEISLAVVKKNIKAIEFYLNNGFKVEHKKCEPLSYRGQNLERIEMSYYPKN